MNTVNFPPETGHGLYREILVWRRLDDDCALCYRCLEDLASGLYAVQSADFHCPGRARPGAGAPAPSVPGATDASAEAGTAARRRFIEGFLDNTTRRAADWGPTLVEAVARYDVRMARPTAEAPDPEVN